MECTIPMIPKHFNPLLMCMDLTIHFQTQQNFANFFLTKLFHIKQLEYVTTSAEIPFVILGTFHKFNFPLQVGASKFHILCFIPCIPMKLESHEFGMISLCWNNLFTLKKTCCIVFLSTFKNVIQSFTNVFNFLYGLICFIKRATYGVLFKNSFEFCSYFILDSNVHMSLMTNIVQN
jgi:hypothetical protein